MIGFGKLTIHYDGSVEIMEYSIPRTNLDSGSFNQEGFQYKGDVLNGDEFEERELLNKQRSMRRSRKKIKEHILNNDHTHAITLTYKKDFDTNSKRLKEMERWLNKHRKNGSLKDYCLVPEKHKNGLIHWHGVMNLESYTLQEAVKPDLTVLKDKHGNYVYNITEWSETGFSSVTRIRDKRRLSNYMTKYMTKEIDGIFKKGQKKYWSSRGRKPVTRNLTLSEVGQLHNRYTPDFKNEFGNFYNLSLDDLKNIIA